MENTALYSNKAINRFINEVFEIAFGDNASDKGYTMEEVVNVLKEFSDKALELEELENTMFLKSKHSI